jgi:hypothetical protein
MLAPDQPTPAEVFAHRPRTVLTARPQGNANLSATSPAVPMRPAGPSFVLRYTAAVLGSGLHRNAQRVALVLVVRADPRTGRIRDEAQLGVRALASLTGLGDAAVRTSISKLRGGGWIRRTATAVEGQPARIVLLIPPAAPR